MLEAFNKNQEIKEFLARYPTRQWKMCLEALVVIGIRSLKDSFPLEELQRLAHIQGTLRRSQPDSPIRTGPTNTRSSSAPHQRPPPPPSKPPPVQRTIPRAPIQRWNEGTPRFKQELPPPALQDQEPLRKSSTGRAPKPLPRYLQSVESKIKSDVKKDIAYFRYQAEMKSQEPRLPPASSLRSSSSLTPLVPSPPRESPPGSQMHLESLTEHRPPPYFPRTADILPRPVTTERTFLTEPNTSLKHADELFSQVSDTGFHKPIREETDAQVRRLNPKQRERQYIEEKSRESAYSEEETGDLIHIAEDFLRDPLMAHLSRKEVSVSQESRSSPDTSNSQLSFKQRWDDTSHTLDWEPDFSPQRQSNASPEGLYYTSVGSYRATPSSSVSYNPRTDTGSYRFL